MNEFDLWLDSVVSGDAKMSQRRITWAEKHGGLTSLIDKARSKGVHLVQLTDDEGHELLACSLSPFKTLC